MRMKLMTRGRDGHRSPRPPSGLCTTEIEHLGVHTAGRAILEDVNLTLHCGELTAIVGRNGAGKTTFMKALLGVIPYTGQVAFKGESPLRSKLSPAIGYVPQSLALDASSPVSVEDLVTACVSRRAVWLPRRRQDRAHARAILSVTHTENLIDRRAGELSGGEIQRVMLAIAIHPVPDILLLDEPVSAVDRAGIKMFYETVSKMRREYDTTVLLISHDLDIVARHADRVVLIDHGIAAEGTVEEVYSSTAFIETFGHVAIDKTAHF